MYARLCPEENMGSKKTFKQRRRVEANAASRAAPAPNLDLVVSEAEAAQILGYNKNTLRREFRAGRAPPRVRLSDRRIGYRLSAIYRFLDLHTEAPGARQSA
jgi:predicted DNA-binding transcriptional regulator AlpA